MPAQTFLALIVFVMAAAGLTIALGVALGVNLLWLGLAALVASLLLRKLSW